MNIKIYYTVYYKLYAVIDNFCVRKWDVVKVYYNTLFLILKTNTKTNFQFYIDKKKDSHNRFIKHT